LSDNSFTILGSSSGQPQAERACSGYLLQTGESLSLIDCGGGVTSSFLRCGFDPMKLDRIFISHTHSDHCCELPLMIQLLHVRQSNRRLDVFIPDEYVRPFLAMLNAMYLFPQHIAVDLQIHGYADGFMYQGDGFSLRAIANQHLEKAAPLIEEYDVSNRMQCHSFRVETETRSLLYSADLGSFEDIAGHLDGLDYAIVESTHIDMGALFESARSSGVGRFVLTHLGEKQDRDNLTAQIEAVGLDNVSLATDGLRLEM